MDDKISGGFELNPAGGVKASADVAGAMSRAGDFLEWLFPRHNAKATITRALSDSIAKKIGENTHLTPEESRFLSALLDDKEVSLENQAATVGRVIEVLPDVQAEITRLPPPEGLGTTGSSFRAKAQAAASESLDEEIREIFARLLAGEICSPGTFSPRTIDIVRSLDARTAQAFVRYCEMVCCEKFVLVPFSRHPSPSCNRDWIPLDELGDLKDAQLVTSDVHLLFSQTREIRWPDRIIRLRTAPTQFIPDELCHSYAHSHLTRYGRELYSVLPKVTNVKLFDWLGWDLSSYVSKEVTVEWRHLGEEVWRSFGNDPPIPAFAIEFQEGRWGIARNAPYDSLDSSNEPTLEFWSQDSSWLPGPECIHSFPSREATEVYLSKHQSRIEKTP